MAEWKQRSYARARSLKSNLSLYSLSYAEACNEFAQLISVSLRSGNTASFEEISPRWRTVGNSVFNLTGPRFEHQISRFRNERVTARPTSRSVVRTVTGSSLQRKF